MQQCVTLINFILAAYDCYDSTSCAGTLLHTCYIDNLISAKVRYCTCTLHFLEPARRLVFAGIPMQKMERGWALMLVRLQENTMQAQQYY